VEAFRAAIFRKNNFSNSESSSAGRNKQPQGGSIRNGFTPYCFEDRWLPFGFSRIPLRFSLMFIRRAIHHSFDPCPGEAGGGMLSAGAECYPVPNLLQSRLGEWLKPMHSNRAVSFTLLLAAGIVGFLFQGPADAIFGVFLAALALIIAIADIGRFEIPDWASALMFLLGLSWVFYSSSQDEGAILDAILRSLTAAGVLYAVRAVYYHIRGFDGLGLGDVKLAAAGAPWLSWQVLPVALLIAVSAAILLITIQVIAGTRRIESDLAVPLGAFLAPAIWLAWLTNAGIS
jgi:leader peptidase (prepilin peptidase) / N-methyltransferase